MADTDFLLQENGSRLKLEIPADSFLILEAGTPGERADEGLATVDLRGLSADKPRVRKHRPVCINVSGRVICYTPFSLTGPLIHWTWSVVNGKVSRTFKPETLAKLWTDRQFEFKGRLQLDKSNRLNMVGKLPDDTYDKFMTGRTKESQHKKLKKLFDLYKEADNGEDI